MAVINYGVVVMSCRHRKQVGRRGFTLTEVLLTLCLLVVITSLAWPVLDKPFANRRLRVAADQIRAEWCRARVDAMNWGRIRVFRHEVEGSRFRIESRSCAESADGSTFGTDLGDGFTDMVATTSDAQAAQTRQRTLPDGVTFVVCETAEDTRATAVASESQSQPLDATEQGWSQPILFYPDGLTSTARLVLKNQHQRCIELTLRGLTGVANVGEVYVSEEALR